MHETKTATVTTTIDLVDQILDSVAPPRPTKEQRALITELRTEARKVDSSIADELCQPTQAAANRYIERLSAAIAAGRGRPLPGVRSGLQVTAKQWGLIRHLHGRLCGIGEGWAKELAGRRIVDDRRTASAYIDEVIGALKRRYDASPEASNGGTIFSVCWKVGCTLGPMTRLS